MNPPIEQRASGSRRRDAASHPEAERSQLALELAVREEPRRQPGLSPEPGARAAFWFSRRRVGVEWGGIDPCGARIARIADGAGSAQKSRPHAFNLIPARGAILRHAGRCPLMRVKRHRSNPGDTRYEPRQPSDALAADHAEEHRQYLAHVRGQVQIGAVMAALTLLTLDYHLPGGLIDGTEDLDTARTAAFTVLVLAQLFNCLNARSETVSAFRQLFVNGWLWGAIALSVVLQVAVVHVPLLNVAFDTVPLTAAQWFFCVLAGSGVLVFPSCASSSCAPGRAERARTLVQSRCSSSPRGPSSPYEHRSIRQPPECHLGHGRLFRRGA